VSYKHAAVSFGPPIFVPVSTGGDWVVVGIESDRGRPSGAVVFGSWDETSRGEVRTSDRARDQPLFIDVANVLSASVPRGEVSLPFTVTVKGREYDLLVDGEAVPARLLASESGWRVTADIDGRVVSAAGVGAVPEGLELARLRDIESVPGDRFRRSTRERE